MKKGLMTLMIMIAAASVAFTQTERSPASDVKPRSVETKIDSSLSFDHLALSVKDVDRSAEFYKKVLGLEEITNKTKIDGIRWFSLRDGKELHLISILKDDFKTNKAIHFALSIADFDSVIKKLDSMKITYSDWVGELNKVNIRADGIKQIYFQDPDGHWIEVNSVSEGRAGMSGDTNRTVESQIIAIEKAGWEAWKNNDNSWIRSNSTDEFLLVSSDGVSDKAAVVKSTAADCKVKNYSLDNFRFVMIDEDSVLMTYTAIQDGVCGGKKIPSKVRSSVVYAKRGGKWLEALYMETPIAQ